MGNIMRAVILFNKEDTLDYERNYRDINDIVIPISPLARHYACEKGWEIRVLSSLWTNEEYI
ncbi:MAG: hypothetical protein K9I02_03910, partial [Haliscomenobacter sp.]|nr:hypothetical protein [Haliscomenobacter sp.]